MIDLCGTSYNSLFLSRTIIDYFVYMVDINLVVRGSLKKKKLDLNLAIVALGKAFTKVGSSCLSRSLLHLKLWNVVEPKEVKINLLLVHLG